MNTRKGVEAVVVAAVEELSSSNRVEVEVGLLSSSRVVVEVGLLSSNRVVATKVVEVAVAASVGGWLLSNTMEVHLSKCISRAGEHPNSSSSSGMEVLLSTIRCKAGERSNSRSTSSNSSSTINTIHKEEEHHHNAEVVAKEGLFHLLVDLLGHLAPTYTKRSRLHIKQGC